MAGLSNVIWVADTNYRIDMENGVVRPLAESDDLDVLVAADQLKRAMDDRTVFPGYEEGPLLFRPTYKYDLYTQRYDTSEKMRIPAWTGKVHPHVDRSFNVIIQLSRSNSLQR